MAFLNRISGVLKQTLSKPMNMELSASNTSLYQAIRSMSSSKLFVGGLSWGTDEMSLREAFSQHGEVVEARVIMDRETGRSRGFGFVTFTSSDEANSAIQAFDGQDLHGRQIRVNYATEKPRGTGFGGGGAYGSGSYGGGGGVYGGGNYGGGGGNYGGGGNSYGGGGGGNSYGGGGGGYGNTSSYGGGGAAGGYGNSSSYGEGGGGYGTSGGGAPAVPAAGGDYFNSGGSSNDGGFANPPAYAAGSSSQASVDEGQRGPAAATDEFGDDVVEGNDRDENDAPADGYANTRV